MELDNQIKLQSIANILLINIQHINKIGLLDGQMTAVLFLYHYGQYTNELFYNELADSILDSIVEAISSWKTINAENYDTLVGIGIGIDYLLTQHFVKGDADGLLKDFDKFFNSPPLHFSPIQSFYMNARKDRSLLNLSELLELQNKVNQQPAIKFTDKTINSHLMLSGLIWEGLKILNQISSK